MNNEEIKEILEILKESSSIVDKILLDYITNLQGENERANQYIDFYKDLADKQNKSLEDYKSRIDKAIDYLKDNTIEATSPDYDIFDFDDLNLYKLRDILKGEDK